MLTQGRIMATARKIDETPASGSVWQEEPSELGRAFLALGEQCANTHAR